LYTSSFQYILAEEERQVGLRAANYYQCPVCWCSLSWRRRGCILVSLHAGILPLVFPCSCQFPLPVLAQGMLGYIIAMGFHVFSGGALCFIPMKFTLLWAPDSSVSARWSFKLL